MNRRGFTVVELVVVIVVVAILATIGYLAYRGSRDSSRDTARRAAAQQVVSAIEALRLKYPNQQLFIGGWKSTPTPADGLNASGLCSYSGNGWVTQSGHGNYPCTLGQSLIKNGLLPAGFFESIPPNEEHLAGGVNSLEASMMIYQCNNDVNGELDGKYLLYYYVKNPTAEETSNLQSLRAPSSCNRNAPTDAQLATYQMKAAILVQL